MMRMTNKIKLAKLTKFILFSIIVIMIYSIAEFICSVKTGITHDTLTTCVFTFFGTELVSCALVKVFNILKIKDND